MTIIIGAGLAGLAAGYTLASKGEAVTILEANDYPGGRVRSLEIDGHNIDFGGFIVYPWYTEYHRLAKELGIHNKFTDIPKVPVYFELERDTYTKSTDISIPIRDTARVYAAAAPKLILHSPQIEHPPIKAFGDVSIAEFLRGALKRDEPSMSEIFADVVCQGYCYGPVDEYRMALVAPIVVNTTFRGDLADSVSFAGNNQLFPHALADYITSHGGTIKYSEQVTAITPGLVTTAGGEYHADNIIFAGKYDAPMITPLLGVETPTRYTTFYTIVVEFESTPTPRNQEDWGALFYLPNADMPFQILSAVNINHLTNGKVDGRFVNFNVIVREAQHTELSKEALLAELQEELVHLFPNSTPTAMTKSVYWNGAMPVATTPFIEAIRQAQGVNNIWYAGDCLGSPSMETALRTGIAAAEQVIASKT
jgi:protoporphyrinogen oxidase